MMWSLICGLCVVSAYIIITDPDFGKKKDKSQAGTPKGVVTVQREGVTEKVKTK